MFYSVGLLLSLMIRFGLGVPHQTEHTKIDWQLLRTQLSEWSVVGVACRLHHLVIAKACGGAHTHMDYLQCCVLAPLKVPLSGVSGKSKLHGAVFWHMYMIFHTVPCQSRLSFRNLSCAAESWSCCTLTMGKVSYIQHDDK